MLSTVFGNSNELEAAKAKIVTLDVDVKRFSGLLGETQKRLTSTMSELTTAKSKAEAHRKRKDMWKEEMSRKKEEFAGLIGQKNEELARIVADNARYVDQMNASAVKIKGLESANATLELENSDLKDDAEELRACMGDLARVVGQNGRTIEHLEQNAADLSSEKIALKAQVGELQETVKRLLIKMRQKEVEYSILDNGRLPLDPPLSIEDLDKKRAVEDDEEGGNKKRHKKE